MWLFECGLDTVEWRRTIIVYLSAMAPIILSLYLIYKNKMKRWISLTLVSSFLIAALGWEIWVNFGLVDGDPVNFRRSDAMTCAIPMEINWLVNSLADTGIVWFAIILVYWIFPKRGLEYEKFQLVFLSMFFIWFMGQNFLVEAVIYHNQVGGDAEISWAPLMPFGPYFNPILISFGDRDITLQSQSAWIIGTIVFYSISVYFYKKTNGK
jgi:hypothetical protein